MSCVREAENIKMTHFFLHLGNCLKDDVIISVRRPCRLKREYMRRIVEIESCVSATHITELSSRQYSQGIRNLWERAEPEIEL